MRPIAVLLLVLGAISALLFAVSTLSSDPVRATQAVTAAAEAPATGPRPALTPLREEDQIAEPARGAVEAVEIPPIERDEVAAGGGSYLNELRIAVQAPDKRPVADATVRLLPHSEISDMGEMAFMLQNRNPAKARKTATTDADGVCTFKGLDPEVPWGVVVTHKNFQRMNWGPITMAEKGMVEEFVPMRQGRTLTGTVLDRSSGVALEGARLALDNPIAAILGNDKRRTTDRQEVVSDASGRFQFQQVPTGGMLLVVEKEGYATQLKSDIHFLVDEKIVEDLRIEMDPGLMIAGRVVGPDLEGISDAVVEAISHQGQVSSRGKAVTGAGGEFAIVDLAEGLYTLKTTAAGWDVDTTIRVEAGETNAEIHCFERGAVMGRVVDAATGKAVPNFTLRVRTSHPTHPGFGQVVGQEAFHDRKNGAFELGGISGGAYVLQADAEGYASTFSDPFNVEQGLTTPDVVVQLSKGGSLVGQVVDSYSGDPIQGVEVKTRDNNWIDSDFTNMVAGISPSAMTRRAVRTDDQGRFEIRLLTPGDYQLLVQHPDYTLETFNDVRVAADEDTVIDTVHLTRGAMVRGTVYTADGSVARGHDVILRPSDNSNYARAMQTRTDANGRFLLENVSPGEYLVSAARPQGTGTGSPFDVIIDMRNSEVDLQVSDGQEYTQDLYLGE